MTLNTPNLTSVRTLITSVTACAKYCGLSVAGVYRWIKVNRIPGKYLTKVCNLYNCEIMDMIHLTGSDKKGDSAVLKKPKGTLELALQVYRGAMTIEVAAAQLGISTKSLGFVLMNWGDELPTLYTTLTQLDEKRITIAEACERLKVVKYTLHGLRRKYGFAPGKLKRKNPRSDIDSRREAQRGVALDVIAGRANLKEGAATLGVSQRTILRAMDQLTTTSLHDMSHWPSAFRLARSEELAHGLAGHIEGWVKFADENRLCLRKRVKYPATPDVWSGLPLRRLLIGFLLDEASLEAIAVSRGADPSILEDLFSADLSPLGLDFDLVQTFSPVKRVALAELLMAIMDRRGKLK